MPTGGTTRIRDPTVSKPVRSTDAAYSGTRHSLQEQTFRKVKRGCRRLHGRGRLTRDVDEMPTGTVLLENLKNREYCRTVYGGMSEQEIAARFSTVDPKDVNLVMKGWKKDRQTSRLPRKLERMKNLPSLLAPVIPAEAGRLRQSG